MAYESSKTPSVRSACRCLPGKTRSLGWSGRSRVWYSPEGSTHVVDSSINYVNFNKKQNVERADDPETPNEAFVFVTGTITETGLVGHGEADVSDGDPSTRRAR